MVWSLDGFARDFVSLMMTDVKVKMRSKAIVMVEALVLQVGLQC